MSAGAGKWGGGGPGSCPVDTREGAGPAVESPSSQEPRPPAETSTASKLPGPKGSVWRWEHAADGMDAAAPETRVKWEAQRFPGPTSPANPSTSVFSSPGRA